METLEKVIVWQEGGVESIANEWGGGVGIKSVIDVYYKAGMDAEHQVHHQSNILVREDRLKSFRLRTEADRAKFWRVEIPVVVGSIPGVLIYERIATATVLENP